MAPVRQELKPSPEVRAALKEFCGLQQEKYGPDWKRILAREMAEASMPFINAIIGKTNARN